MLVFTHEGLFGDKAQRARRLWLMGLISIFISFVLSFSYSIHPVFIYLAYPFLLAGLPLWTMGRSAQRRLKSAPRPDRLLNAELKGLNNKYSLHHYSRFEAKQLEHLLVTPDGLIVMTTSDVPGPVYCKQGRNGDKWSSPTNLIDKITGQRPAIGDPTHRAADMEEEARRLLASVGKASVPVKALVVFTTNPDIEVAGCSYPAVTLAELKRAVREVQETMADAREGSQDLELILASDDRRRINNILSPQAPPPAGKPVTARR